MTAGNAAGDGKSGQGAPIIARHTQSPGLHCPPAPRADYRTQP